MCYGCWQKYGAPMLDNTLVYQSATAIAEVYNLHSTGGHLHIVIDDWNLEDDHLDFCQQQVNQARTDPTESTHLADVCQRCINLLRAMTLDERASALALYDKFWVL